MKTNVFMEVIMENMLYIKGQCSVLFTNNKVKLLYHKDGVKTYKKFDVDKIQHIKAHRILVIQHKECFDKYTFKKNELVIWMGEEIDELLLQFIKKVDYYACEEFFFWGDMNSKGLWAFDKLSHKIPSRFETYYMNKFHAEKYKHLGKNVSSRELVQLCAITSLDNFGPFEQEVADYLWDQKINISQIDILEERLNKS
jgi:hypothetical protein